MKLKNKVDSVTLADDNVTLYPKVEKGHYLYFVSGEGARYVKPAFVAAEKGTAAPDDPMTTRRIPANSPDSPAD